MRSFGEYMSRIVQTDSLGQARTKLSKLILISIRELMKQTDITAESKDLAAFIVLALKEISSGIDPSVEAWEKRGYWVKADRFRMEWEWSGRFARQLEKALMDEEWASVPLLVIQIAHKFENVKPPSRNANGKFWAGSFSRLNSSML